MARLFYMALPGVGEWSAAMREAGAQLAPYRAYLTTAKRAALQRALSLAWRTPTNDELRALERRLHARYGHDERGVERSQRRRDRRRPRPIPSGTWIVLEARPGHGEEPEATFEEFLEAKEVYDRPLAPGWSDGDKISILESDREAHALLLAHPPSEIPAPKEEPESDERSEPNREALAHKPAARSFVGPLLFLRPNTWNLECQRRALESLENRPAQRLAALVRLISTRPTWGVIEATDLREDEWVFLRPDSDAVLRDGTTEQRDFVRRALGTPDFAVLEGPPGSGKTTAICELIVQLTRARKRVLLVASTHVAVDNVLERLIAWQDSSAEKVVMPIRIGDERNVTSEAVAAWTLQNLLRTWRGEILDHLDHPRGVEQAGDAARGMLKAALEMKDRASLFETMMLEASNLVCGTTIGILQHPEIKAARKNGWPFEPFDYLIIDEASKATLTEFLVPAIYAKRWVVVGDKRQLSPYVEEQDLVENLRGLLTPERSRAAVHAFVASEAISKGMRMRSLVAGSSDAEAGWLTSEAAARGVAAVDLDATETETLFGVPGACAALLYADVVFGKPATIKAWEHRLPGDLQAVAGEVPPMPAWEARQRALRIRRPEEPLTWEGEVAWRQVRAHELRQNEAEQQHFLDELRRLRPTHLVDEDLPTQRKARVLREGRAQSADEALEEALQNVQRVSMPSILEILQQGAGSLSGWIHQPALTGGLPSTVLRERMVSLSFQHRMHPDISAFPRAQFYAGEGLLKDAAGVRAAREWDYSRYARRAVWLDIQPHVRSHERHSPKNSNRAEAQVLIEELEKFTRWAATSPRSGGDPRAPWEVAVLTFYRGQEKLLRERLQRLSDQDGHTRNFRLPRGEDRVRVTLCTADRFQGHEADLVFLSFVKSGSVGFLNSPNRLNVALTRARYQLVLIGHQRWFSSKGCRSELLRGLGSSPLYARDIAWGDA